MADRRINYEAAKKRGRKFVRYSEGSATYGMGLSKFQQLAHEAKAVYKIDGIVLVNLELFDSDTKVFGISRSASYNQK